VVVKSDAVDFTLSITAKIKFKDGVGRDDVGVRNLLPGVAGEMEGVSVVTDGGLAGGFLGGVISGNVLAGEIHSPSPADRWRRGTRDGGTRSRLVYADVVEPALRNRRRRRVRIHQHQVIHSAGVVLPDRDTELLQ